MRLPGSFTNAREVEKKRIEILKDVQLSTPPDLDNIKCKYVAFIEQIAYEWETGRRLEIVSWWLHSKFENYRKNEI